MYTLQELSDHSHRKKVLCIQARELSRHAIRSPEDRLMPWHSCAQVLQLCWWWAETELVVSSGDVRGCSLARNTSVDDAVEQGVTTQAVVAVDAARCLTSNVQAWDHTCLGDALGILCALQASHAVVDHRGDDGDVEWLSSNLGALKDVVVELLAAASWATGRIP